MQKILDLKSRYDYLIAQALKVVDEDRFGPADMTPQEYFQHCLELLSEPNLASTRAGNIKRILERVKRARSKELEQYSVPE